MQCVASASPLPATCRATTASWYPANSRPPPCGPSPDVGSEPAACPGTRIRAWERPRHAQEANPKREPASRHPTAQGRGCCRCSAVRPGSVPRRAGRTQPRSGCLSTLGECSDTPLGYVAARGAHPARPADSGRMFAIDCLMVGPSGLELLSLGTWATRLAGRGHATGDDLLGDHLPELELGHKRPGMPVEQPRQVQVGNSNASPVAGEARVRQRRANALVEPGVRKGRNRRQIRPSRRRSSERDRQQLGRSERGRSARRCARKDEGHGACPQGSLGGLPHPQAVPQYT